MISNEERRNIAERLRKTPDIHDISQDELMYVLDDKLENNLKENGANEFEICETIVKRIADLIEPKTCRAVKFEEEEFGGECAYTCSECGELLVKFDFESKPYNPIGYCPNCGAKVVENEVTPTSL